MQLNGSFTLQERGFMHVTGTVLHGASVVPAGLNTRYTMYLAFNHRVCCRDMPRR